MSGYALIRWLEEPPKWDVIPVRDIRGQLVVGARVEARFESEMFPAVIVQLGTQTSLNRAILTISDEQSGRLDEEPTTCGGQLRQKTSTACENKTKSQKAVIKKNERLRAKEVLEVIENRDPASQRAKDCTDCRDKDETITWLRQELRQLRDAVSASTSIKDNVRRFEDAVVWLEEVKKELSRKLNSPGGSTTSSGQRQSKSALAGTAVADTPSVSSPNTPPSRTSSSSGGGASPPGPDAFRQMAEYNQRSPAGTPTRPAPTHTAHSAASSAADDMVTIGPCTSVSAHAYHNIHWGAKDQSKPVRELLVAVFTRDVLAISSMTGQAGNANSTSAAPKPALDPAKLRDTFEFLRTKLTVQTSFLRSITRHKCNDEAKLQRRRQARAANRQREEDVDAP